MNYLANTDQLVLRDSVGDGQAMRIIPIPFCAGPHLDIQIPAILVIRGDPVTVLGKLSRRKWLSRLEFKTDGLRQLLPGYVVVTGHLDVANQGLRAFFNLENHI